MMVESNGHTRVLFVCTGNICRSPTAEAVFRTVSTRAGMGAHLQVDSAGTIEWHVGNPPASPRRSPMPRAADYDLTPLRARQVTVADFGRFIGSSRWTGRIVDREGMRPPSFAGDVGLFPSRAGACRTRGPRSIRGRPRRAAGARRHRGRECRAAAMLRRASRPRARGFHAAPSPASPGDWRTTALSPRGAGLCFGHPCRPSGRLASNDRSMPSFRELTPAFPAYWPPGRYFGDHRHAPRFPHG